MANLKSRLTVIDPKYRELVAAHEKLQAGLHADYTAAFATHKTLSKLIARHAQTNQDTSPAL